MLCRAVVYYLPNDESPYEMDVFAVTFEQLKQELRKDLRIPHKFLLAVRRGAAWRIEYIFKEGRLPPADSGQEVYQVVPSVASGMLREAATQPVYVVPGPFGLDLHLRRK
jgi:hypothetical protein